MDSGEGFLGEKLKERVEQNAYRQLRLPEGKIDFCSNDYLGIVKNNLLTPLPEAEDVHLRQGSTGSRLLTGNYALIEETERIIAGFHEAGAGLIFNSGYDANVGLLSSVPRRGDTILYDQWIHASIRDGIRLSFAKSFPFQHNDPQDLEKKLKMSGGNIFVVTESIFSMDGDLAPLNEFTELAGNYRANLVVDEAHATGIIGKRGEGLVQELGLQNKCFARIHTFGKAVGCHGAIVLGSESLRNFLINFSRPFIYSTALPESSIAVIRAGYSLFPRMNRERDHLNSLISQFQGAGGPHRILKSPSPIQGIIVPGNENARKLAQTLAGYNLDIRPILYPSVPKGAERLRIVLHSFNTREELNLLIRSLVG
jgi:8-amino-7-oxononanoate synthase